ncbi:MAG: PhnA domain-containing protein [Verrucomicrobia bacterium]|nr:PhnA domain-containing protein [Verrucomicrobiota bacterium]
MKAVLSHPTKWECETCGFEWDKPADAAAADGPRVVKDAHGTVLVDGDHEIDCRIDGIQVGLKAYFVKKA